MFVERVLDALVVEILRVCQHRALLPIAVLDLSQSLLDVVAWFIGEASPSEFGVATGPLGHVAVWQEPTSLEEELESLLGSSPPIPSGATAKRLEPTALLS